MCKVSCKILLFVFLFASGTLYAQEEPILDILFTDPVDEAGALVYDEVTTLKQLEDTYRTLFPFSSQDFYSCYDSLNVSGFKEIQDSLVTIDVRYQTKSATGYAYFKPATAAVNTAIFIVPGSGFNQSGAIYRNASNYHNLPEPVSEAYRAEGDVYVYIKPNEDILAIHMDNLKLNQYAIYPHLLHNGRSYSSNYLIQCLGFIKMLKSKYERVIVLGLSQGGYASFLLSLISEPTGSVVASGYSVLGDEAYYGNVNQIIIDDLQGHFSKEAIYEIIDKKSTLYLFSWGKNEGDYYEVENEYLTTYNYFKSTNKVDYYTEHTGHYYPPYEVMSSFMHQNNIRPLVSFKRISDCKKFEEFIVVEGMGALPIKFQMQFENGSQTSYRLDQRIDTIRNLADGNYTFSNPQNAELTSVYKTALTIRNPKTLSEVTLQAHDFTFERLGNVWIYNHTIDTLLLAEINFTDAVSNSFAFHPQQQITLPSGTYNRFAALTRGGCIVEKDIDITLEKPYFSVYPNPCTDHFLFEVNFNPLGPLSIAICDLLGEQVAAFDISLESHNIDLSGYNPGIYLVRVFDRKNQIEFKSFKIIKN